MAWARAGLTAITLMLAGCATSDATTRPAAPYRPSPMLYYLPRYQAAVRRARPTILRASWYGSSFDGKRTSSGELYRPWGLTAASRTLPIGSHVKVTNLANGRSVTVRINDRGPYVRGRQLDLSRAAARRIGMTHRGVARVAVTRVRNHPSQADSGG